MPLTDSLAELTQYVVNLLTTSPDIQLGAVYYGDQTKLPTTPCACVEPDSKRSEYKNSARGVDINFTIHVIYYESAVRSAQTNRKAADLGAEAIERILNADAQQGGLVIDSIVTNVSSGYSRKDGSIFRSSRVTFTARSQARLPS